jgi:hypothetical protein
MFDGVAALAPSAVIGTAMKTVARTILPFSCASNPATRRTLRKDLLRALRISGSPVIVDVSACGSLNHEDIDLLLDCVEQAVGLDTQVLFVAGSLANRVLLEITRIASLAPVFNSVEEALAYPQFAAETADGQRANQSQQLWSA